MKSHIETSQYCWCKPTLVHVAPDGSEVWVHHEPDSEAPQQVIDEAIALSETIDWEIPDVASWGDKATVDGDLPE